MPSILNIRDTWVILDREAASQFGTETRVINQAVARHRDRFTAEFAFRLTTEETASVRSQLVTSSPELVARLRTPNVFTEEGVILLATVLNSEAAIRATKYVVRTFVEVQRQRRDRENALPEPDIDVEVAPDKMPSAFRRRVDATIKRLADVALTEAEQAATIAEAQRFKEEGLSYAHNWLLSPWFRNAEKAARIQKELAEAESIRLDNRDKKRLALIRELLLIVELERASIAGDLETFSRILQDLDPTGRAS